MDSTRAPDPKAVSKEQERLRANGSGRQQLEALGSVLERAAMGNGARGLQRGRHRLGIFSARSCAQPRLSLGRGRHRRHLGRGAAGMPVARALERAGPDPQGAPVRPHQLAGQSWRGRQGGVFLPGRRAVAFLSQDALQVSAARVSVCGPGRRECAARHAASGIRIARHRRLRGQPLLRRLRRVRASRTRRCAR